MAAITEVKPGAEESGLTSDLLKLDCALAREPFNKIIAELKHWTKMFDPR